MLFYKKKNTYTRQFIFILKKYKENICKIDFNKSRIKKTKFYGHDWIYFAATQIKYSDIYSTMAL
jgi:hypothetical protein